MPSSERNGTANSLLHAQIRARAPVDIAVRPCRAGVSSAFSIVELIVQTIPWPVSRDLNLRVVLVFHIQQLLLDMSEGSQNIESTVPIESLQSILIRIIDHLKNDKKFNRSVPIFIDFMNQSLSENNAQIFYDKICELLCECPRDPTDKRFSNYYQDLFVSIFEKKHIFPVDCQYRLQTFKIFAKDRPELCTDDSYQFSKSCQVIKSLIEDNSAFQIYKSATINTTSGINFELGQSCNEEELEVSTKSNLIPEDELIERQKVLILALETACLNFKWSWAKSSINELVKSASERRMHFREPIREDLDSITERITLMERKSASWTCAKKVLSQNSVVHPLFVKKCDVIL